MGKSSALGRGLKPNVSHAARKQSWQSPNSLYRPPGFYVVPARNFEENYLNTSIVAV